MGTRSDLVGVGSKESWQQSSGPERSKASLMQTPAIICTLCRCIVCCGNPRWQDMALDDAALKKALTDRHHARR